jgi:hypothetical protein
MKHLNRVSIWNPRVVFKRKTPEWRAGGGAELLKAVAVRTAKAQSARPAALARPAGAFTRARFHPQADDARQQEHRNCAVQNGLGLPLHQPRGGLSAVDGASTTAPPSETL